MQTNDNEEKLVWVIRHINNMKIRSGARYGSFAKFSKSTRDLGLMELTGGTKDIEGATQFRSEALAEFYLQNKMINKLGKKLPQQEWFVEGWVL